MRAVALSSSAYAAVVLWLCTWASCAGAAGIVNPKSDALIPLTPKLTPYIDSYIDGGNVMCQTYGDDGAEICFYRTDKKCLDENSASGTFVVILDKVTRLGTWRMRELWCSPEPGNE